MNLVDANLRNLLASLSPADRRLLSDALKEGAQLGEDVKEILRWLRRRLKRRVRSKRK